MKTIRQQEHARKAYQREYQKQWQKRFKEEHGMSYRDAIALKKAVKLITERAEDK